MTFGLAHSPWPRYGYDRQNSSCVDYPGPTLGRVTHTFELPYLYSSLQTNRAIKNGCVIAEDGSLRVFNHGCLSAWSPTGKHLWTCELPFSEFNALGDFSLPVMLKDGRVLFHTVHQIFLIDHTGFLDPVSAEINQKEELIYMMLDDSGFSPNLTHDGQWVFSTIDTGLLFLQETEFRRSKAVYGYDLLPPAIYSDGHLAVADYAGVGFCRVNLWGEIQWHSQDNGFDGLVSLNQWDQAAVSNGRQSVFFDQQGHILGAYEKGACFAVYGTGWIALSENTLASLDSRGYILWEKKYSPPFQHLCLNQPITTQNGLIYVVDQKNILCLDKNGKTVFELALQTQESPRLSFLKEGLLCAIADNTLFWIA